MPLLNSFHFTKEQISRCWTNRTLEVTVIQLTTLGETYFREKEVEFIKIGQPNLNNNIAVLQFLKEKFKFVNGTILDINKMKIKYSIFTAFISLGSPIINYDCDAIGIYNEEAKSVNIVEDTDRMPQHIRSTYNLRDVLMAFFDERYFIECIWISSCKVQIILPNSKYYIGQQT